MFLESRSKQAGYSVGDESSFIFFYFIFFKLQSSQSPREGQGGGGGGEQWKQRGFSAHPPPNLLLELKGRFLVKREYMLKFAVLKINFHISVTPFSHLLSISPS